MSLSNAQRDASRLHTSLLSESIILLYQIHFLTDQFQLHGSGFIQSTFFLEIYTSISINCLRKM